MCKIHCEAGVFVRPLCFLPCQSHTVASERSFLFRLIWSTGYGGSSMTLKSLVHVLMVTEYSLSWLSWVMEGLVLFMVIHNLVRSWICRSGAEGACLCRSLLRSQALISVTDMCRVSWRPPPCTPPQGRGKGRSEGGDTKTDVYSLLKDWSVKNKV